ncbi:serine/threonine-protein kinase 40-like protein [Dinothrombium tinctorium]|uniref:Serine/threonine-protein kinase 40 n=1 Tax=Dinothrombium tinctorium TaxID=1965070 RepID=A0A3S3PBZ2_9ACAR|nr:serine/threonine-protein kinase 40-like protein [Dinothrombium tinctorium]RWS09408.1 serine/threonine-protein kinase 40-like protein [Dinothrombium tinctorium]RWS09434.1 serine/threonine-protein kinase 40-like protein [Dinothrombium tinctorium]
MQSQSLTSFEVMPATSERQLARRQQEKRVKGNCLQEAVVPVFGEDADDEFSEGTLVSLNRIRKTGPYILGQRLGNSPVKSIVQCLARNVNESNDKFYTIKILTLQDEETQDERQGKMLLHTEYSLLSLLQSQEGVIRHYGLFKDEAWEEVELRNGDAKSSDRDSFVDASSKWIYTGKKRKRVCLVLDCLFSHNFSPESQQWVNLQHHVIKEKKLSEKESIRIFYDAVRIVSELHKKNVVHRDLKLGNMVLNRRTRRITLINFCLGKHLANDNDLLKDQRGSPAYISPDVLSGKPYLGKPSDMWALGVVLFTMLYGQFPFYDSVPQELFRKIKSAEYSIPKEVRVSEHTQNLIKKLLVLNPKQRFTAEQVVDYLQTCLSLWLFTTNKNADLQVVPDNDNQTEEESVIATHSESKDFQNCDDSNGSYISDPLSLKDNKLTNDSASREGRKPSFRKVDKLNAAYISHSIAPYGRVSINARGIPTVVRRNRSDGRIERLALQGNLPLRRIEEDGRSLTAYEIMQIQQMILRQRQLQQHRRAVVSSIVNERVPLQQNQPNSQLQLQPTQPMRFNPIQQIHDFRQRQQVLNEEPRQQRQFRRQSS